MISTKQQTFLLWYEQAVKAEPMLAQAGSGTLAKAYTQATGEQISSSIVYRLRKTNAIPTPSNTLGERMSYALKLKRDSGGEITFLGSNLRGKGKLTGPQVLTTQRADLEISLGALQLRVNTLVGSRLCAEMLKSLGLGL